MIADESEEIDGITNSDATTQNKSDEETATSPGSVSDNGNLGNTKGESGSNVGSKGDANDSSNADTDSSSLDKRIDQDEEGIELPMDVFE